MAEDIKKDFEEADEELFKTAAEGADITEFEDADFVKEEDDTLDGLEEFDDSEELGDILDGMLEEQEE